jgi:hypothetical protein
VNPILDRNIVKLQCLHGLYVIWTLRPGLISSGSLDLKPMLFSHMSTKVTMFVTISLR